MAVALTITTEDATPTVAPYVVSHVATKTAATVQAIVTGVGPLKAYRLQLGGVNILTGTNLRGAGFICGATKCGHSYAVPTQIPTPKTVTMALADTDLPSLGSNALSLFVYDAALFE